MSADAELCFLSIGDLARGYLERQFSPVEVTEAYLRRIQTLDGSLHSYITVTAESARTAARHAEQRIGSHQRIGPLDGVPFGVKDLFDTAGIRTTANSRLYQNRVPARDAAAVRHLTEQGAVLLGKHAMDEFASGGSATDAAFPPARNPWNSDLVPGGSSSGSAVAVSAGLCAAALGTDTGGSIRLPASFCGVVGLKPSSGLVSRSGVIPLSWTLDHAGPLTRTVEDAAIMLQFLAGYDSRDYASVATSVNDYRSGVASPIAGLRIGAPITDVEAVPLNSETMAAYMSALSAFERLGARIERIDLPESAHITTVSQTILTAEAFAYHENSARNSPEKFGRNFYARLLQGAVLTASDYIRAQRGRTLMALGMQEVMRQVDVIVLPSTPHPASTFAEQADIGSWKRTPFTRLFNITGQPAISIPCGFTTDGLPIGLQVAGRLLADELVLATAFAYERAHDWRSRRPLVREC